MYILLLNFIKYIYGNFNYLNLKVSNYLGLFILINVIQYGIGFIGISIFSFYIFLIFVILHILFSYTNLIKDYVYDINVNYLLWYIITFIMINLIIIIF